MKTLISYSLLTTLNLIPFTTTIHKHTWENINIIAQIHHLGYKDELLNEHYKKVTFFMNYQHSIKI